MNGTNYCFQIKKIIQILKGYPYEKKCQKELKIPVKLSWDLFGHQQSGWKLLFIPVKTVEVVENIDLSLHCKNVSTKVK